MAVRDSERCEHCGHQFRTGLGTGLGASPVDAPLLNDAALNRTMQFTLPPLPREAGAAPEIPSALPQRRRRVPAPALAALGVALAGALAYFHYAPAARAAKPSPAGVWETTPAGGASPNARLRLVLRGDGGGAFSWQGSRPTPLHWRLDPDGRLSLNIPPPAATDDAVSGTLITILDSHPWLWRVDRTRHRLLLGTLNFTEK